MRSYSRVMNQHCFSRPCAFTISATFSGGTSFQSMWILREGFSSIAVKIVSQRGGRHVAYSAPR